jgi:hypothetical protein
MGKVVEIQGVKLEIDERTAKTVDSYKIGDPVKVLIKRYSDTYNVHPGVIVGFCDFRELPSIEIMYLETDISTDEPFKIKVLNEKSTDVDIAPVSEFDTLLDKQAVEERFARRKQKLEIELLELEKRHKFFNARFATAFERVGVEEGDNAEG